MIRRTMNELEFPAEAIEYLAEKNDELLACDAAKEILHEAYDCLFGYKVGDCMPLIAQVAEISGIHDNTVAMIFFLNGANTLRYIYKSKGIPDGIWLNTMQDLRNKLIEYKKLSGLWGTKVGSWLRGYYTLDRFALGRLQFNKGIVQNDCADILKTGDTAVFCHIPSSGPLNIEDAKESFRRAREWFKDDFKDGKVPLVCSSWLLYPPMTERLGDNSNIKKFAALFDIYSQKADETNGSFWRIFYRPYSPEAVAEIEPKTSLERTVIELIREGGSLGAAMGVIKEGILD